MSTRKRAPRRSPLPRCARATRRTRALALRARWLTAVHRFDATAEGAAALRDALEGDAVEVEVPAPPSVLAPAADGSCAICLEQVCKVDRGGAKRDVSGDNFLIEERQCELRA